MMTTTVSAPTPLIGHYVPEVQSLAKRGLLWAVLYGLFARGSSVCYTAVLGPSPIVWLAMAVVFIASLGRAAKATDTAVITRILSRAATAMWVLPLVVALLNVWAFFASSPDAWVHGTPPPNVTVQITSE